MIIRSGGLRLDVSSMFGSIAHLIMHTIDADIIIILCYKQLTCGTFYMAICFIIVVPTEVGNYGMVGSVSLYVCLSVTHFFRTGDDPGNYYLAI